MTRSQGWRARALAPLLRLLRRANVRADGVTAASAVAGLSFALFVALDWYVLAIAGLVLHLLLDGLDGPVARDQRTASRRGSLTDTLVDQLIVTTTTLALVADDHLGAVAGGLYVFTYTVLVAFAMVRNALAIPYSWLVRPRLFVYAWIPLELFVLSGTLDFVVTVFTVLMAWKVGTGFWNLRRRLT